jgi:hypothetical protein
MFPLLLQDMSIYAPLYTDFLIYLHEVDIDAGTSQKKGK